MSRPKKCFNIVWLLSWNQAEWKFDRKNNWRGEGEADISLAVNQSSRLKNFIDPPPPPPPPVRQEGSQQVIILGNTGFLLFSPMAEWLIVQSTLHTELGEVSISSGGKVWNPFSYGIVFFIFEYFMLYFLSLFNFVLCPQYFFYKLPLGGWGEISLIYSPRPLALHWNLPFLRCLPIVAKKFFFVKYF